MKSHYFGLISGLLFTSLASTTLVPSSCKPANSPADAAIDVDIAGVCSLLEGFDSTGTIETICATAEEIAQVVSFILTLRNNQTQPLWESSCTTIPTTQMCASMREIGMSIEYLQTKRRAVFILDAGGEVRP